VRESEKPARVFRADQESGDFGCAFDVESQWFGWRHFEAILAEDVRVVACLADRDGRAVGVQVETECRQSDESCLGVAT